MKALRAGRAGRGLALCGLATISMAWLLPLRAQTAAPSAAACLACHSQPGIADGQGRNLTIAPASFAASVHGALGCPACHADIQGFPHKLPVAKVDCAKCHAGEGAKLKTSVHRIWRAASLRLVMRNLDSPACLNCHGNPHAIVPVNDPRSPVYPLNLPRTCGACHGNPQLAKKYGLPNVYSMYVDSIHGMALTRDGLLVAATCTSCHGAHQILSHNNPRSPTFRARVPATCGKCHAGIAAKYLRGAHGQALRAGVASAPVCISCHTAHSIANVRTTAWQLHTTAQCGGCHSQRLATYRDTFHGQVTALGFAVTARCWNCHRAHEILPASNPKSSIAPANLPATCGQCHGQVPRGFISYNPHADPRNRRRFPGLYYTARFMNLLLLGVFTFFGIHTVLWFSRSISERTAKRGRT